MATRPASTTVRSRFSTDSIEMPRFITPRSGIEAHTVRQVVCLERSSASILPLLPKKGGEGPGRGGRFSCFPSLRLSPHSFLAGRERKNALSVFHAEHYFGWRHPLHPDLYSKGEYSPYLPGCV